MVSKRYMKMCLEKGSVFTLSVLLLCLGINLQAQHRIYVATGGNDAGTGSLQQPLRTLQRAIQKAEAMNNADVSILLREGIYYLDSTIYIRSALARFHSLQIMPYGKEQVTLSGARPLQAEWELYRPGIYRAKLLLQPAPDRLYLNGHALPMARYPNYDSSARVFNGTAADAISPKSVKRWNNPAGGYVHALHAGEWGGFHYRIKRKSNAADTLELEGGWQNNRPSPMHKQYRFVENIFEELDAPGEWYYDANAQQLYLYPPAGVQPATARLEAGRLEQLLVLEGSAGKPLKGVTIQGLRLVQTNRTFMQTKEPLLRSDWTIYRGGAILCNHTAQVTISGCTLSELGGNAIFCSNYNRDVLIKDNHIFNVGASALAFVGSAAAVRSPAFRYEQFVPWSNMDYTPGPANDNYPRHCRAEGNLVHDIGLVEKQGAGVQIAMSEGISIVHNTIYNVPRAGINIGDGCWGGHLIAGNDVFNTVLETGDHGAFNSWGRDRFWRPQRNIIDSIVQAKPGIQFLDAITPTVIRNNRFYCAHGWDIDLDDGSSNYIIEQNLCLSGGLKLREGYRRIVRNNILVNNTFHPHVWLANSQDVFTGNIVTSPYAPIGMEHWGSRIDSNYFLSAAALDAARQLGLDSHGTAGPPPFAAGYRVQRRTWIKAPGLLAMEAHYGVTAAGLRQLASNAPQPALLVAGKKATGKPQHWLGAVIKNIEGLGERSAAGLTDENGVLVVSVAPGSPLAGSGLRKGDVLVRLGQQPAHSVNDLLQLYQQMRWMGQVNATIVRNQAEQSLLLRLKDEKD